MGGYALENPFGTSFAHAFAVNGVIHVDVNTWGVFMCVIDGTVRGVEMRKNIGGLEGRC